MYDELDRRGFMLSARMLERESLEEIDALFHRLARDRPGTRIDVATVTTTAAHDVVASLAKGWLGDDARIVRAILFDKSDDVNWSLGWHQDRTIEVAAHVDVPGFGPFTWKQGRLHVAPPIDLTARMLTMRIHVDPVDCDNGPLIVAPGSRKLGNVPETDIARAVALCGEVGCLADAGNVWLYSTPILHRSDRSAQHRRRRVLQLDFSADMLPGGLVWSADTQADA